MLSAKFPVRNIDVKTLAVNLEINMFWDGLFHVFTWIMTAIGIAMLWHAVRQRNVPLSSKTFVGSLALGWGLFNLVEGIIDHHILHVHHVTETDNHLIWDVTFLYVACNDLDHSNIHVVYRGSPVTGIFFSVSDANDSTFSVILPTPASVAYNGRRSRRDSA